MNLLNWRAWLSVALLCGLVTATAYEGSPTVGTLIGEWGGDHIRLVVKETSATFEFDCAFGKIHGRIQPDGDGNFEIRGVYRFERGGPRRMGGPPSKSSPAMYRGWTNGKEMRLTVKLVETGREMGPFTLSLGRPAALDKCL